MKKKWCYILAWILVFMLSACNLIREERANPVTEPKKELQIHTEIPADVEYIREVEYGKVGDQPLRLSILRPKEKKPKLLPVIVWIHGGGWNSGSRNDFIESFSGFAQQGYFFVSIDYRLSTQAQFPAQLEDCKSAIRFLRTKAREYQIDPNRIGVWGASAGAHLAGLLGVTGDVETMEGAGSWLEHSSKVQAVCDWYGPTDFTAAATNLKYPIDLITYLLGESPLTARDKAARASIISYISKEDPPFLIMHGDQDDIVPLSQSQILHEYLSKAGVQTSLVVVKGAGHGFGNIEEFKEVRDFFDKHLK